MAKRILKWFGRAVAGLVAFLILAALVVYVLSERELRRQYTDVPLKDFTVSYDAESVSKGKRLATLYGCFNSCHGDRMQGLKLFDEPGIARIVAPNITRIVHEYTDAELERLIRHGVKRDGTSTWIMPSQMFARMSDEDLASVIAFVRTAPVLDGLGRDVTMRPLGRIGIVTGKFNPLASKIDHDLPHAAKTDKSDPLAFGEYLVKTSCTECHGQNLEGDAFLKAPSLVVLSGYSEAAFRHLMKTGLGIGERKLGLMTEVSMTRYPQLTDEEFDAMSTWLRRTYGGSALAKTASEVKPTASRIQAAGGDDG
jgi:mono/diheme cytochrome c family protein